MNFQYIYRKINLTDLSKVLLLGIAVIIGTFPENDWSFGVGIDQPLSWAFNHIYQEGFDIGKNIIFTHGPLAFLMYPQPNNVLLVTIVFSLLKILLVLTISFLFDTKNNFKWLLIFATAYLICILSDINHLIISNIILLFCNYFNTENLIYKITAFILTAFALYIKSYVAIVSLMICISFVLYYLISDRNNFKKAIFDIALLSVLTILIWCLMYGTFFGVSEYFIGMFHLAQDNSSAASTYPYNNWILLTAFLLITFSIPIINKNKKSFFYGTLTAMSLFAAWKHGMAREDSPHVLGFLSSTIITLLLFVVFNKNNLFKNLLLSIIAIFLLFFNIKNYINYDVYRSDIPSINNFIEFITDYSHLKEKSIIETKNKIRSNQLPLTVRDSIRQSTVDIYPWDYSIIAANCFNWQPRRVLQLPFNHWLDNKNAEHFNSENAPEFIIWQLDKGTQDLNGGSFNSIDNRYLLNDEPLTIIEFLRHYNKFYADNKFLVLKKRNTPILSKSHVLNTVKSHWGEWIDIPENHKSLLRAKLQFTRPLAQRLKSFLYKDEQFWVYLKLQNDVIHKYRIVPKNAVDGIWINPYILDSISHYEVKQISFKSSNQYIISEDITIRFENFEFNNDPEYVFNFFNIKDSKDSILLTSINNFEKHSHPHWDNLTGNDISQLSNSGKKSYILKPNAYSTTFTFQMDSLPMKRLKIATDCWINASNYKYKNSVSLILSIDDKNGKILWKGISIDEQLLGNKEWYPISNYIQYENIKLNSTLKIYLWNNSDQEILIDDFRVIVNNRP